MTYAHVYDNYRQANYGMAGYIKSNPLGIKKVIHYRNVVIDNNGNDHHFLSGERYETWCKGKEYKLMNAQVESGLMYSGYPVSNSRNME